MPKITKYDGTGDPEKHLSPYKTHMSLRGATPTMKCRTFHLTLTRATEIWYSRLPHGSIRSWPEFKNTFLKMFAVSKEGETPIQRLQDMRQAHGESLKSFLSCFTDEMTCCMQVADHEALAAPRVGLNTNTLFWREVQNQDPTTYDALLEMIRWEIINEELIENRNRANRGFSPQQRQRARGPTSHLMDHQINPPGNGNSRQALVATTLNVEEEVWGLGIGLIRTPDYCTYHHFYGHDTSECREYTYCNRREHPQDRRNESPQANRPPPRNDRRPRHEETTPR
ncbi:uncharacterized protein LOC111406656 [Olea europaea var. sylvestris]|uniref:uncharacterized protein LOC111406656 n=1 Tax=Olea europaea var. sylvestris TaxID=158386 RepID=UPI000C1D0AE9|nr:uncharacterized protein LOC111406656 [Olea europaea var. sylvestris]